MLKNRRTTLERIEKFVSREYFTDVNLFGRLYPESVPLEDLRVHSCGYNKPSFEDACLNEKLFVPAKVGSQFGPTWTTHWFKVVIKIPDAWLGKRVHFRWNSESEAMLWSLFGTPLFGFSGDKEDKTDYVLSRDLQSDALQHVFYVEMACNRLSGVGSPLLISPPDPNKMFTLKTAEVSVFDPQVNKLIQSLKILFDMAQQIPESSPRSYEALYAGNDIINILQKETCNPYEKALSVVEKFFGQRNGHAQHELLAVGHCHIDCAWLWPYSETIRKCARSWASVVDLMETYPDYTFACSQAKQFEWVKTNYSKLYDKIKFHVARGKFLPVGGTWVEMDGNIPSGESFMRQFLYGQTFFKEEFGSHCSEFWLPDTFGYSAQLPQVMRHMKIGRFLTQKLSWSLVNKFPHHNFIWEGLDGSSVTVHFPPGDSYEMEVTVKDALKTVTNLADKGRVSKSLLLFGHGDGGGGPTEAMLERGEILQDVDGIPKVRHSTPTEMFEHLEMNADKLCRWSGELYLELHNATYTTQANMKKLNRDCENLLRDVEFWYLIAKAVKNANYPKAEIENLWKIVLLNQFHDVLPGTSIQVVHEEATSLFNQVLDQGKILRDAATSFLLKSEDNKCESLVALNTLSWPRTEVASLADGSKAIISAPSMGLRCLQISALDAIDKVQVLKQGSHYLMKNKHISAVVNSRGEVTSLQLLATKEEYIAFGKVGNQFVIFDDVPLYWDAWDVMDYHMETKKPFLESEAEVEVDDSPVYASITFSFRYGGNHFLKLKVIIDAVHPYLQFDIKMSWGPIHKFLKIDFPVSVHAQQATYEIQFGHIQRPTHYNTSWDWAKYEVCGHKWMDLSEYGKGVAILNNNKYGHSVHKNTMTLSLLRSPTNPDAKTDQQEHEFSYAIMPHQGSLQESEVIQQAYGFNNPLITVPAKCHTDVLKDNERIFFEVSHKSVIIETVKAAEVEHGGIILRMYEAYGGRCQATVSTTIPILKAKICNGLEEQVRDVAVLDNSVTMSFAPFEIVTLLLILDNNMCVL